MTDFGAESVYVAEMKAVIFALAPEAKIIDLSHSIRPYDIGQAERFLRRVAFLYPRGAVHTVVVDPGVGSERKPVALSVRGHYFVGPDNGIFTAFAQMDGAKVIQLDRSEFFRDGISNTFHGRDIFAPIAGRLATGMLLESLGSAYELSASIERKGPREEGKFIKGEIVDVDRFGNLITNIPAILAPEDGEVTIGEQRAEWVKCYSEGQKGKLLVLEGSDGYVELALKEGSAADFLDYPNISEVSIRKT